VPVKNFEIFSTLARRYMDSRRRTTPAGAAVSGETAMPFIHVRYSNLGERDLRQPIAAFITEATAKVLRKKPEVSAVVVEQVPADQWFIGGKSLAEHRKATFFVEVRVTQGTNLKEEKTAYLREVFRGMESLLGPVHPESYIHVNAVEGDAYGYGGVSQEARWVRANS
jgi:4-oxalocrotonate tautomerase